MIKQNAGLQDNVEYLIGALEALLCLTALIQAVRISCYSQSHSKRMLPKKIFHIVIVIAMLLKSTFFIVHPLLVAQKLVIPYAVIVGWFEAASFFIFLAFLALVLFWADFYDFLEHGSASPFFKRPRVRAFLGMLFSVLAVLAAGLFVLLVVYRDQMMALNKIQLISEMVIAGMFLAAGLAYTIYGLRLASLLRRVRLAGQSAIKVALVATSITVCFVARSAFTIYLLYDSFVEQFNEPSIKFDASPYLELGYFFITEILPIILMLFFLRKLPRWKEASVNYNQYKTIQFSP